MNARFSAHLNNWKGVIPMSENGDILEELWEVKRKMAEKVLGQSTPLRDLD